MSTIAQKIILIVICAMAAAGCAASENELDSTIEATAVATAAIAAATEPPLPSPTQTALPPTATSPPANTPVPPTNTLIPPTNTPVPPTNTRPAPPTQTPAPTIEPTPTELSESLTGPDISFAGVQFTVDPALGNSIIGTIAESPFGGTALEFDWEGDDYCDVGRLRIWNTADLEAWDGPGPWPPMLREAMASPYEADFPTWGAAIVFQAKTRPLTFQNGSGIRALTNHAQAAMLANNESLRYEFYGFTKDEQMFIYLCFPVAAPILLDSSNYPANSNPQALPLPEGFDELDYPEIIYAIQEYNRGAETAVEALADSELTPNIALLDALVQSLEIGTRNEE